MIQEFSFTIPQQCQFGVGALSRLPDILARFGSRKVMLISGPVLDSLGVVGRVRDILLNAGLHCTEFLVPEPTVEVVHACAAQYKTTGSTAILALGGGSPMDVAKAAAVVARYGGRITDYEGAGKIPGPIDPLIAIPTTAGTGSEVTTATVITDVLRSYKLSVLGPELIPAYAVLDPELILGSPASVAATCGVDALIHAMESYINLAANPFSMTMAEKAMELLGRSIRAFVRDRNDLDAACDMLLGSTFAGLAFANNRLGDIHALSHPISAFFNVPHGVANAVLMPAVFAFNAPVSDRRYAVIYRFVTGKAPGEDFTPEMLCDALRELNRDLGLPACLDDLGVTEDKIPQMAADAMKSGNIAVNPRPTTLEDVETMYHAAMYR